MWIGPEIQKIARSTGESTVDKVMVVSRPQSKTHKCVYAMAPFAGSFEELGTQLIEPTGAGRRARRRGRSRTPRKCHCCKQQGTISHH